MSMTPAVDDEVICTMETREAPPAHFLIKIESFSMLEKCGIDKYETKTFDVAGNKWRLVIYPNGEDNIKDCEYVSVNLAMADTSSLPANWEVNAVFSISLFNQISGKYLSSLGVRRSFIGIKAEWGLSKFISKNILLHPSNGYLVNDTVVFGAEVFVIKRETITECLYLKNDDIIPYRRDWKISNFSKLEGKWESEEFIAGGHKWTIKLFPNGNGDGTGSHVSIYLYYLGSERVKACYTVSIKNQVSAAHQKCTATRWFSGTSWFSSQHAWGWPSFIDIVTINDPNKGFIVKDSCLLQVEISVKAVAK